MFRTFSRKFLPNRLDWMLKRLAKRGGKTILLCWNRGLGDIPLGIAAIVHRIYYFVPDATIHVLTRSNLEQGFSLLKGVKVHIDPAWKRGEENDWKRSLVKLGLAEELFDLVISRPLPTDWCSWQHKTFIPRLSWSSEYDSLYKSFGLEDGFFYIGVQVEAETTYGLWRNWPQKCWHDFFDLLAKRGNVRVLLFGYEKKQFFPHPMVIDLRGRTNLLELLSIIKNRCSALVLPDSGILSFSYYLDVVFPIRLISLWGDPRHGILKQGVSSPNPQLIHTPLVAKERDLSTVSPSMVVDALFPKSVIAPLRSCARVEEVNSYALEKTGCVILAGGQGSRLGIEGPKGLFPLLDKTLFQHLLEKVPISMPVAIMTSPLNHDRTIEFLEQNGCFGRQISFFQQEMVDLLDENYAVVGQGPNGNGSMYRSLLQAKILEQWEHVGIDTVIVVPVDNPMADPADEKLVAFHRQTGADVIVKCIERKKNESMGALGLRNNKLSIVEYFAVEEDKFLYSYTGQLSLSTEFIRKAAGFQIPYHWVRKKSPTEGLVWKREQFLFDVFSAAESIKALCYPRDECYAPIKELENKQAAIALLLKNQEIL